MKAILILLITVCYIDKESTKKSTQSIRKIPQIDTFFQKRKVSIDEIDYNYICLLYTSPSPRD